jgi:hypothetical protein
MDQTLEELIATGRIMAEASRRRVRKCRHGLEELKLKLKLANLARSTATEQVGSGMFLADLDEYGIRIVPES